MTGLYNIYLQDNQFAGDNGGGIPTVLSLMTNLAGSVDLSGNPWGGTIHTELGRLRRIYWLGLGNINATGTIPTQLGFLTNLLDIGLENNNLVGTIPPILGSKWTSLKYVDISNNPAISGTLPSELGISPLLESLHATNTGLTGAVPAELCQRVATNGTELQVNCDLNCTCCEDFYCF